MEEEAALLDQVKTGSIEFQRLFEEHQRLEKELEQLNMRRHLTPQEEFEKKRIQKQKLATKDRMAAIIREFKKKN